MIVARGLLSVTIHRVAVVHRPSTFNNKIAVSLLFNYNEPHTVHARNGFGKTLYVSLKSFFHCATHWYCLFPIGRYPCPALIFGSKRRKS
jgi:hypothetical protein